MFSGKTRTIFVMLLSLVTVATLVTAAACTPAEAKALQGVLKNVDSANGTITIVTKDGKTVTVKIATETGVSTNGTSTSIETLEPGASVDVEIEKNDKDDRVARHIEARQAEVAGIITGIESSNITIKTERDKNVTVSVTDSTIIKLANDLAGTLADLSVGMLVEAKFDPLTNQALKIGIEEEEEGISATGLGWGILEIRVTDPPPADVKSAVVYLSDIEVHKVSGNASDNTSGWVPIIGAPASFDLMDVIGVEQILGSANITAGRFTQIRMKVTKVEGITTDNVSYTAEVPSGELKIVRPFNVGGGKRTVLTLDFDGRKSLIQTGQGKFLFKPVVKLLLEKEGGAGEEAGEHAQGKGRQGQSDNVTDGRGSSENERGNRP
ncbi:MAG: DUF4382 domain-containing protein [Chloroflexi bacterium]|nr:DUF4382 domain-containing protein [Chloroflexota bacterium]